MTASADGLFETTLMSTLTEINGHGIALVAGEWNNLSLKPRGRSVREILMRQPDSENDGWRLDDGEERHLAAPDTFWIPKREARESLQPGDLAKLIFLIDVDDPEPVVVERMWVVVRERIPEGYLGILYNTPAMLEKNDRFCRGVELAFAARHVINIAEKNAETVAFLGEADRRWSKA